jgi:hypothetical protein
MRWQVDDAMDSERRPLRPIGASVAEVAARTGRLLTRFSDRRGVRLLRDVAVVAGQTPIAHAISSARLILLIESVAWPGGTYSAAPDGGVRCDGAYIGQSVQPLIGAVRQLRHAMPRGRLIEAVLVVHPSLPAAPTLPATGPAELTWLSPVNLAAHVAQQLRAASYCQSDINTVTLSWPPATPGS